MTLKPLIRLYGGTAFRIRIKPFVLKHKKLLLTCLVISVLVFSVLATYILWGLPDPTRLVTNPSPASTKLLDRNGELIYELFVDEKRTPVDLESLPQHLKNATLAAEDREFYSHIGFSLRGITRAFINTSFRNNLQGGSTITQQLARSAFLVQDRTLTRKIRELVLSLLIEARYSKDDILEFYLNQISYGGTSYGIESASRTYFGKPATALTLSESALLAGLPQAPSYYSPFGSQPEQALVRQQYVLDEMLKGKFITQAEHDQALQEPLHYTTPATLKAAHFSLWVKDLLLQKYGDRVYQDGLVVTTTLDLAVQNYAQDTVASETAKLTRANVTNGATLVTNPRTGEILAMVGSKDYTDTAGGGNVNVVLRPRQPGSSIKPITYAMALDKKLLTAATVLSDKPTCFNQVNQKTYCPSNYDNQFHGPTQVRFALGNSFNIPAVKALTLVGLSDFVASSSAFGLTTFTDPTKFGPSITLGGGEVTMLDLSTSYGVLANAGKRVDLNPITKIVDRHGTVLEKRSIKPSDTRVISPGSAFIISHALSDNGARSAVFGAGSLLNIAKHPEVSVKTGTTNDLRDNWTIGYTPDFLVAVWVGNNDNSAMSRVASGVTGASPIWNKIMTRLLTDRPQNWPIQPPDVVGALVCATTGERAPDNPPAECPPRYEYFIKGTQPGFYTSMRRDIAIYRPTQAAASQSQITDEAHNIEYQNHAVIIDPLGTTLCLDCAGGYGAADTINLDRTGRAARHQ